MTPFCSSIYNVSTTTCGLVNTTTQFCINICDYKKKLYCNPISNTCLNDTLPNCKNKASFHNICGLIYENNKLCNKLCINDECNGGFIIGHNGYCIGTETNNANKSSVLTSFIILFTTFIF